MIANSKVNVDIACFAHLNYIYYCQNRVKKCACRAGHSCNFVDVSQTIVGHIFDIWVWLRNIEKINIEISNYDYFSDISPTLSKDL